MGDTPSLGALIGGDGWMDGVVGAGAPSLRHRKTGTPSALGPCGRGDLARNSAYVGHSSLRSGIQRRPERTSWKSGLTVQAKPGRRRRETSAGEVRWDRQGRLDRRTGPVQQGVDLGPGNTFCRCGPLLGGRLSGILNSVNPRVQMHSRQKSRGHERAQCNSDRVAKAITNELPGKRATRLEAYAANTLEA